MVYHSPKKTLSSKRGYATFESIALNTLKRPKGGEKDLKKAFQKPRLWFLRVPIGLYSSLGLIHILAFSAYLLCALFPNLPVMP